MPDKLKRVRLELVVSVEEGSREEEYARAYCKFMERITKGDFGQENIIVEDLV